jgi:threonine-phosphate decarboxylase
LTSPCKQKRFVSHGGDVWGFSRKYNIPLEKVLDFSGPVNFLGPSPKALEAVRKYARLIKFYPDPNPVELKTKIAKYVGQGVDAANIILGNGSIELIYMITEVFSHSFKAVIPVPSFTEYEKAALRVGGEPIFVQLPENFALDAEVIKKAVTKDTRILYICNPHSPSGTLYSRETILDLADFCHKKDIILSVDENYIEFTGKTSETTLAGYVTKFKNLFVIRSVTKFYGMPGIRFGYGIAAESLIDGLQAVKQPWSINSLAGYTTLAAFNDREFIENTERTIVNEREQFAKGLSGIDGLHVFPSVTNFLLVKILNKKITTTVLREEMAKEGILIRDCSTFVGLDDSYFRVTVRASRENEKLIAVLKRVLEKNLQKQQLP